MTYFLHKASGVFGDGGFWSFGLVSSGSVSEAAAETGWGGAVNGFFTDANVNTYYDTAWSFTGSATSTASSTFKQTTKTETTWSVVGTSTNEQMPTIVTPVASLYSGQATRWGRGRMFLPAMTAAVLDTAGTGQLSTTARGNIATALSTMFGALATAGLSPILVTRRTTKSGRAAYSTEALSSGQVHGKFRVQSRRSDKIVPSSSAFTV